MHQLLSRVLGLRDLSRAGDLFSLEDAEIEAGLSQALDQIKSISCSPDYLTNDNDQAVVEICITRITSAIRETGSIHRHSRALVGLWESCLDLTPHNTEDTTHNTTHNTEDTTHNTPHNTEDTPHTKIASDITSCILQNYSCPSVMLLAVPVAVRFLERRNLDLSRNMSSYLCLAAMSGAELLTQHTHAITCSVTAGNHMLLRVLPSLYPRQPEVVHRHLSGLVSMLPHLEPPEQQHLVKLLQMVAEQHPLMLSPQVPALVSHLSLPHLTPAVLGILLDVSQASPSSLVDFLPVFRTAAQHDPALLGHVTRIHGAVGIIHEAQARDSLLYLVSLLGDLEVSGHHGLLQEIRALSDRFPSLGCSKDVYRLSNSFSAVARQLRRRLEDSDPACIRSADHRKCLQLQDSEGSKDEDEESSRRRFSLSHMRVERREMRFNRSKSLAITEVRSRSLNLDSVEDGQPQPDVSITSSRQSEQQEVASPERKSSSDASVPPPVDVVQEAVNPEQEVESDRLFHHLRDNMETIKEFCQDLLLRIPIPDQCVIEDSNRGFVARLSFSCPLKRNFCLYSESSFVMSSRRPHLWIHLMLLQQQSRAEATLRSSDECVRRLASLWEKTRITGSHSFTVAMTQQTTPHKKDLDNLQIQLKETRFFDLFGFSEAETSWICFMCNNPEKAAGVNQEGRPLMEGKLKEKQVRWKFIKRWRTRYFTLAGNQLLFRKGKSKDDEDPIELSKVQSVKVVARKRRERGLPRAFEIFADNKTYVLKAEDEEHAEQWLQCINVAVAQARERQNHEATTYL